MQIFQGLFIVECLAFWLNVWEAWKTQLVSANVSLICLFIRVELGLALPYLGGSCSEGLPVDAGNDVADKLRLKFQFLLLQFGIMEM